MTRRMRSLRMKAGMAAALLALAGPAFAGITSGQLLTNFVSATYNLPGGGNAVGEDQPGYSGLNVANSATAWVYITCAPQLCLSIRKDWVDCNTGAPKPQAYPGDLVAFKISFSNCGSYSGFGVFIQDVFPANLVAAISFPNGFWTNGNPSLTTNWATSQAGPWNATTFAGQKAPLYIRWNPAFVGMNKSGYVRYCATIL